MLTLHSYLFMPWCILIFSFQNVSIYFCNFCHNFDNMWIQFLQTCVWIYSMIYLIHTCHAQLVILPLKHCFIFIMHDLVIPMMKHFSASGLPAYFLQLKITLFCSMLSHICIQYTILFHLCLLYSSHLPGCSQPL